MFNIAKEDLIKESLNNLNQQILNLANQEKEDVRSLTLNFIDLKNKVDTSSSERNKIMTDIEIFNNKFNQIKEILSTMNNVLIKIQEDKVVQEEIKKEVIQPLPVKEVAPEVMAYCIDCKKASPLKDMELSQTEAGDKMAIGSCVYCGRKLFKIQ